MSLGYFLLALCVALLNAVFAEQLPEFGRTCPYNGVKDPKVLAKLKSEEFLDSLSPFSQLFLMAMPSEDFFFKLFDTSFKPETVHRTFFLSCVYWEEKMGLKCPVSLCKRMAGKVANAFKNNLSPLDYFSVVATTLENSLMGENSEFKSMDEYAIHEKIKAYLNDIAQYLCSPDVNGPVNALFALDNGSINFYKNLGVNDKKILVNIARSFGHAFAKFGKQPTKRPTENPIENPIGKPIENPIGKPIGKPTEELSKKQKSLLGLNLGANVL